jgi:hypothetical protein
MSIHKSQGMSIDIAEIDVGSDIFECGQTYVALSRVKSLEGLYLTSFDVTKIKMNNKVKEFYSKYWNYKIYPSPPRGMPKELIQMKRANPDTAIEPYNCWQNNWWAVPVYKSFDDLNFRGSPVLWWDQSNNEIFNNICI